MTITKEIYQEAALSFVQHLATRAYGSAYAMTSAEYRAVVTLEQMKRDLEATIPLDWGEADPIAINQTMDS